MTRRSQLTVSLGATATTYSRGFLARKIDTVRAIYGTCIWTHQPSIFDDVHILYVNPIVQS